MYKGKEVTKEYTKMLGADPLKKELVQSEKDWIINFGKCVISLKLVALIYTGIINYLIITTPRF